MIAENDKITLTAFFPLSFFKYKFGFKTKTFLLLLFLSIKMYLN